MFVSRRTLRQIPGFSSGSGGRKPQRRPWRRRMGVNLPSVVSSGPKDAALIFNLGVNLGSSDRCRAIWFPPAQGWAQASRVKIPDKIQRRSRSKFRAQCSLHFFLRPSCSLLWQSSCQRASASTTVPSCLGPKPILKHDGRPRDVAVDVRGRLA